MTPFEEELREALKREDPPPGFVERVLWRIPEQRPGWKALLGLTFRLPQVRWAMAGTLVLVLLTSGVIHQQRELRFRAEGEQARAQVLTALRIASVKLNTTRRKVQSIGRNPEAPRPPKADETQKTRS